MSVYPGKGGQEFIPSILNKIPYLYDKNVLIGIDGGINDSSIKYLKDYQIDNIVSGSFICLSDNYDEQINKLKNVSNKWYIFFIPKREYHFYYTLVYNSIIFFLQKYLHY